MVDVENLKINKRLDVKGTNLRITKIGNQIWENWFISKGKYENWQNCEQCEISNRQKISKFPIF